MSDDNNKLIQLAGLGNVSDDEIKQNLQGQPKPVEEESDVMDFGEMENMFYKDPDGTLKLDNPYDAQMGVDFDQFESQGSFLGAFNRVTGLDEGFTYTGIDDTYNRSQAAQGSLEKMRNGLLQFVGDTGINVAQGFGTLLYGLPASIINRDFTSIYDNAFSNSLDRAQEKYDKYFDIKHGGDQNLGQRATNFIFDDFLGGVSFVAGAILTETAMTAATAATLGGAAPAQAAATAGIVARGSRLLKNVVSGGKRVISGQIVDDAVKGFSKLGKTATAQNAANALGQAGRQALTRQGINTVGRVSRQLVTGAGMEAGMEARHMMNAAGDQNKREYELANGAGSYTDEMEEAFRQDIGEYGDAAFLLNTALVGGSNILMFPKLFGVGMRSGMKSAKFIDTSKLTAKARESLAKRLGVEVGNLPKLVDAARGTRVGRNLRRLTPGQSVGATAAYEGLVEEGGQGLISRGFEDYIADKYDPANMRDTENLVRSISKGIMGSYGTAEGRKEILIGMLLGAFGIPNVAIANTYKEVGPDGETITPTFVGGITQIRRNQAEQDARMNRLINLHEENGDVLGQTKAEIHNSNIQRGLARQMDIHVNNNDMKRAKDTESDSIFAHATSKIATGRFEDAIEESREILNDMSVEDFRTHLGEAAKDMTDAEIQAHKTKVHDKYVERMNKVREAHRQAQDIYRGEDPDVQEIVAKLMYDTKNRDAREQYLAESIAERIKGVSGSQIVDGTRLQEKLKITDRQLNKLNEIEEALAAEEAKPDTAEDTARRQKIIDLNEQKDALETAIRGQQVGSTYNFDTDQFAQDLSALRAYHAAQARLGVEVGEYDITEAIEDLREIQQDREALINAYNDLLEPGGYQRLMNRLQTRILARYEEEAEEVAMMEDLEEIEDMENPTETTERSPDATDDVDTLQREEAEVEDLRREGPDTDSIFEDVSVDDVGQPITDPTDDALDIDRPVQEEGERTEGPEPGLGNQSVSEEPQQEESAEPGTVEGTIDVRVQSDSATMNGKVNEYHEAGSNDLVANGLRVGEEVTITRGTIVKDGVAEPALEFSVRGNVVSRVPITTQQLSDVYDAAVVPLKSKVKTFGRLGSGTRIAQPMTVSDVLNKPGQIAELAFYTVRQRVPQFFRMFNPDVSIPEPTMKTVAQRKGKPYLYIKDTETGQMVYMPVEAQPIGVNRARALLYLERAHAVVSSDGLIQYPGMTLEQARQTLRNFEQAYGVDPRLSKVEKAKVIGDILGSFFILDNGDAKTLRKTKNDSVNRLKYFAMDTVDERNQPGMTMFRKELDQNGERQLLRSNKIGSLQGEALFVRALGAMRTNVSVRHGSEGIADNPIYANMQVVDGVVQFGEQVTPRRYYASVLKFTERAPLMVNDQPYANFINKMTVELSELTEVPTEEGPGAVRTELELPEEFRDALAASGFDTDNFLIGTEFEEGEPMQRAGRLYQVPGMTNKEVSDALNMLVGRLSQRMLRHSRTKERNQRMDAGDFYRLIGNDLKALVEQAKNVLPNQPAEQQEGLRSIIESYEKLIEPKRYDKLMQLTFMEALRLSRGIIQIESDSIGEAMQKIMDTPNEELTSTQRDSNDIEVQENPMAAFDDNFAFGVDPKSTLRLEMKLALMTVQYTTSTASTGGIYGRKFIDFNTLTHQLNQALAGVEYEWSEVKKALERESKSYPHFNVILDILDENQHTGQYAKRSREVTQMMQKQFVVFAAKDFSIFDAIILKDGETQDRSSNSRNMEEFAKETMETRFIEYGFYNTDGTVNTKKIRSFLDKLKKVTEDYPQQHREAAKAYEKLFASELGLRIPAEALTEDNMIFNKNNDLLLKGIDTDLLNNNTEASIFGRFRKALRDVVEGDTSLSITDSANEARLPIQDFLVATARYQDNLVQNTSKDASNKLRYHYSAPKHISKLLRELVFNRLMPGDITTKTNYLLERMRKPNLRRFVKMSYIDGIKFTGMSQVRDFQKMSVHDKLMVRLGYYMNNNVRITERDGGVRMIAKHLLPTLADKSTMPLVQVPSLRLQRLEVPAKGAKPFNMFDLDKIYDQVMRGAVEMEATRIRAIRRKTGDVYDSLTATQKEATRFSFLPGLDPALVDDEASMHREAKALFAAEIDNTYKEILRMLRESRVVNVDSGTYNFFDPAKQQNSAIAAHFGIDYKDLANNPELKAQVFKAFIAKYAIESFDFNVNMISALLGDPGTFGNNTKMGKRFAALIAPGTVIPRVGWLRKDGTPRSNHRVRALILPDRVVTKSAHEAYLKRIGLTPAEMEMYSGFESADGAEYTTAEEHLSILYAQGKITQGKMQEILAKVNAGTLSKGEREVFFQPMKPVTVEKRNGHLLYIKSASFPLVPGLTQNTELDKLRVFMEENNLDRAIHTSALKVGNPLFDAKANRPARETMKDVYDKDGNLSMDAVEAFRVEGQLQQVIEYDRTSMRIQQEVPSSEAGEKVHGSQVAKLNLVNMADDTTLFTMNGKSGVTGREMHERYMDARDIELMAKVSRFAKEYGLRVTEDGVLVQEQGYSEKLAKRLYEEGVKRNYDINELAHLHYDIASGAFSTPITQGPSAARIESLMMSILRSEIITPKIFGFGGPIRPETGLRYQTLEDMDQSDITWVTRGGQKVYDGKRLKVSQDAKPNQIIMPWKYRSKIPVVDGVVKAEDLPAEMLQAIAYRIPGQKKASSAAFEIVGFLPKSYGDTLIVPEELIGQIGQDYDIDKMYGFLFEPTEIDGKLIIDKDITAEGFNELDDESKIRVAHNQMVEIYNQSMLTDDPNASLERHRPITDGYSRELAEQLGLTASGTGLVSPANILYNDKKADTARAAKDAIGVFASATVLHAQLEQAVPGLLKFHKVFRDPNGQITGERNTGVEIRIDRDTPMTEKNEFNLLGLRDLHDDTFLLEYSNMPKAGSRADQFSVLLNHAVDNENNQLLGALNINAGNWGMWNAMTHMGYNLETIALFMNTPYVAALAEDRQRKDGLANRGTSELASTMLKDARDKVKRAMKNQSVKRVTQLAEWSALDKRTMLGVVQGTLKLDQLQEAIFIVNLDHAIDNLKHAQDGLMQLTKLMKHDTKTPKTRSELEMNLEESKVFLEEYQFDGTNGITETDKANGGVAGLIERTVSGQVYETLRTVRRAVLDIPGESVYATNLFKELLNGYSKLIRAAGNTMNGRVAGEALGKYSTAIKKYLNAKWVAELTGQTVVEARRSLTNPSTGVAARVNALKASKPEVRDNIFIKQLIPIARPIEGYSRIEFTGDRVINVSPMEMHGAFLSLVQSSDPEVRQLAEDLVAYALVNGGALGSRSYAKYIPAEFLQQLGLRDAIGTGAVEYMSFDPGSIMHEQIVRHNPELAPTLDNDFVEGDNAVVQMSTNSLYATPEMKPVVNFGYVRIKYKTYKISDSPKGPPVNGLDVYGLTEVQELGDFFAAEYAPDVENHEKSQFLKAANEDADLTGEPGGGPLTMDDDMVPPTGMRRPGEDRPAVEVDPDDRGAINSDSMFDESESVTRRRPGEPISKTEEPEPGKTYTVSEYAEKFVKSNSLLLRQLLEYEAQIPVSERLKVVMVAGEAGKGFKANYRNDGNHTLIVSMNNNGGKLAAKDLAHELVHAYTVATMDNPKGEARKVVAQIENLRKQIVDNVELQKAMGFDPEQVAQFFRGVKVLKLRRKGMRDQDMTEQEREDLQFVYNNRQFYGLFNAKEFVAEALTNSEFAAALDKLKLGTQGDTFLKRAAKYITDLLASMNIIKGNDTYLEEVAALTMNIIIDNASARGVKLNSSKTDVNDKPPFDVDNMLLQSEEDIHGLSENTIQAFKDYKEKRLRELKEMRARYKKDKVLVQRMNQRIGLEQRDLDLLNDDSVSVQDMVNVAQRELSDAKSVLDNAKNSRRDLLFVQSALENVSTITEFYANLRGIAKESAGAREAIDDLVREAAVLREDYFDRARELSRQLARDTYKGTEGEKHINEETFERIVDPGQPSTTFLDATRQGLMELNFLDRVIRDASLDQKAQFNRRALRYMQRSRAFKNTAYFKKHKWEGMVQLDNDGNPTPQLISAFSGKWEADLAAARKKYRKQPKLYRAWLDANTEQIDVTTLYDYKGDEAVRKNNPAAVALLEKKYGKLGAEEFLQRQDKLMKNYVFAREAEFDIIESTVEGKLAQEQAKAKWLKENDPKSRNIFNKYLFNMPLRSKGGRSTGYYDARFAELQKDPEAIAFYREYRQQMTEMMGMLPLHKMGDAASQAQMQNGLFIPAIRKAITSEIFKDGVKGAGGRMTDEMLRAMTVTEEDNAAYLIDPVTGRQREELSVQFTNKLADPSKQEYNMDRTFLAFAMMATTYESKNKIEDTVRMTRTLMSNINVTPKIGISKLRSKLGAPLSSRTADDRKNVMKSVNTLVDRWYGHQTMGDVQGKAPRSAWPKDVRKEIENLEREMERTSDLDKKQELQDTIDRKTPKFSAAKTSYGVQQWVLMKGMGLNIPAAATNAVYGTMAGFQYAAANEEFDMKTFRGAAVLMLNSIMNGLTLNYAPNKAARKIQGMFETMDVLKDFTEMRFQPGKFVNQATRTGIGKRQLKGAQRLKSGFLFMFQEGSEYLVYGAATIALLKKQKVNGKSLWESMDENGIIQIDGYRPGEENFNQLVNKIDQVNKRIHGNYDPNSPIEIKSRFYGPLIMAFKSWLPEAVAQRVQSERYDPLLDRDVKGRWNTMFEMGLPAIKEIAKRMVPFYNKKMTFDDSISRVDQENLRKSAANFRQMMYLYIFVQALQALMDDDDDDNKYAFNFTMNIAKRVNNDLNSFMVTSGAMNRLVNGVGSIPALGLLNDIQKFGDATIKTIEGDDTIPTGVYAGKYRMLHHGGKLIPHSAAIQKLANNLDRVMELR